MSGSKTKRTITVEKSSSDGNLKSKPSVFERLGAPHTFSASERQEICLDFAKNGACNYGSKCKYSHVAPRRDRERDRDDLRNRVSRKHNEAESDPEAKKSVSQRKDKDSKIKSAVVVTKSTENIEDIWPEPSGDVIDKVSVDRKHDSKSRQQGSLSSHGTEGDGHKASKQDVRLDDRKDEGSALQSSSSKTKNKSPSRGEDESSRRKSKDKKKKKRNKSQGSRSPDRAEDKQEHKHQKDPLSSSKSSSDKHKSVNEARKAESSTSATEVALDRGSQGSTEKKPKDEKNKSKSVENRLLMLAMESETKLDTTARGVGRVRSPGKSKRELSPPPPPLLLPPPPPLAPPQGKGKDARKDYTSPPSKTKDVRKERVESPSKGKKAAKERSMSPTRSKDVVRRDRSVSPSRSKNRGGGTKSSHSAKLQNLPPLLPVPGRASEKLKPPVEEKALDQLEKREGQSQKMEKVKGSRKRRRSSTSSASSSSSSSSGSDSGSSSGSSSSGSSSSGSSGSSDESSDDRKPMKERRGKDGKQQLAAGRQSDAKPARQSDEKGPTKGSSGRSKKDKERTTPQDESRARRQGDEKDNSRTVESTKHGGHGKKDLSPGRGRKKDWDKAGLHHGGQDGGLDSRSNAKADLDKTSRDSQDRSGNGGESSRLKPLTDAVEYSRKARSPTTKDDRSKPATPAGEVLRRGQSPGAESLRSHHSTKPLPDPDRDLEGQSSSGQYRDYYSSREKPVARKEDDRYNQPPYDELYAKKHPDPPRGSQGYSSSSQHRHHSTDPYDRTREATDQDRDERESRYSRDHGYEADRYAADRHHTAEVGDESRSRQDYYSSSSYRDERRSGRTDDFARKETDRLDKHASSYEATRESDRDYDARDREKGSRGDQRTTSDYREKPRAEAVVEHSASKYKKDGPVSQEVPFDDSRRERPSRRGQWESERETDDQARQMTGRSDPPRGYPDKRESSSRKRPLEEEVGSGRSPSAKKMREGSPSESHHSFSSRTAYDRDADRLDKERDRSQRGRNVGRDDDRHSNRGEGEYRDKGRSDRDRGTDKDWESSRRHDSKDRSKDSKVTGDGRERGSDVKDSWHSRDDSHKRRRSVEKTGSDREGWDRGKDWKRSRIDPEVDQKALQSAERDKPMLDRGSRREEDHRGGSPSRDRSPKASGYAYKQERTDGDKRSSDSLAFVKSIEAEVETRAGRVKSEEKRDLVVKDAEPSSMIPVHVDDRMRRSGSRGSLGSKHSQRDRSDTRRDDRHYEDRFDLYNRDGGGGHNYRDERLPLPEQRPYEHDDREPWARDRNYDRGGGGGRPEEDAGRPFRGAAFDHDRGGERDAPKGRDFGENDWDVDPFRRDSLGYRGIPRPPNWERDRPPRDEWDNRYDRGLEPDFRARREALLPPPPRPRAAPEVSRVPSPLPPPVEPVVVPAPVEHIPVRAAEVKPEHVTPTKPGRGGGGAKDKDEDTGYDDISDGELDDLIGVVEDDNKEEHQVKKTGVVDILDIKWESLMQNSHEKPAVSSSILSRFQATAIFRRIGVSRSFAGEDLLNQVKAVCQEQLDDEESKEVKDERRETEEQPAEVKTEEPEKTIVKEEPDEVITAGKSTSSPTKNAEEVLPPAVKVAPIKFDLLDDIADFHAGLQVKSTERVGIVTNVGPYRRALCARRDLAIRRGLCKVEKEDILMFPTHVVDQDLYKQSLQLFHHDRTVEKKLPPGACAPQRLQPVSAA